MPNETEDVSCLTQGNLNNYFLWQVGASQREIELGNVCKSLQQQVSQLQEVLNSVSNYVFQGGVISADNDETGKQNFLGITFLSVQNIPKTSRITLLFNCLLFRHK